MLHLLVFSFLIGSSLGQTAKPQFKVIKEWEFINFTWPDPATYKQAVQTKSYQPENIIIAGVMYYDDFYYLSLPRMKEGVPVTVARVPTSGDPTPLLEPYPSWEMNLLGDCNAIQNSQNVEVDAKGRMWIIDSGRTSTLSKTPTATCPPKLVIYDIPQKKVLIKYEFPEDVANKSNAYLYDLVVDDDNSDAYAYISDNSGRDPGIIVYSLKNNSSRKLRHPESMRADQAAREFKVDGISITAPINIAGLALGPNIQSTNKSLTIQEDRELFYSPLSSKHLYSISTAILKNFSNAAPDFSPPVRDVGLKSSQTDGMIMDDTGILYYGLLGDSSVGKWDSQTPFASGQKVISRDAAFIQWPNSFTFDLSGNLILLTNRLHKFIYGKMDLQEPNFRLLSAHTGTKSYLFKESGLRYEPSGTEDEPRGKNDSSEATPGESHFDESGMKKEEKVRESPDLEDHSSVGESEVPAGILGQKNHSNRLYKTGLAPVDLKVGAEQPQVETTPLDSLKNATNSTATNLTAVNSPASEVSVTTSSPTSVSSTMTNELVTAATTIGKIPAGTTKPSKSSCGELSFHSVLLLFALGVLMV